MDYHELTLTQNLGYPTSVSATAGGSGSWTGKTYFAVGAVYGEQTAIESIGIYYTHDTNVTPVSNQVVIGWAAPSVLPNHYVILYKVSATAPDWKSTAWNIQDLKVANNLTSITLTAPDPTGSTIVLGSSAPSVVLNPILNWNGDLRQQLVVTANGTHRKKSWAKDTLYTRMSYECSTISCTAQEYRTLQKWARYATLIKVEESADITDYQSLYSYFTGTISSLPEVYSYGKVNAPEWELEITIQDEVYRV